MKTLDVSVCLFFTHTEQFYWHEALGTNQGDCDSEWAESLSLSVRTGLQKHCWYSVSSCLWSCDQDSLRPLSQLVTLMLSHANANMTERKGSFNSCSDTNRRLLLGGVVLSTPRQNSVSLGFRVVLVLFTLSRTPGTAGTTCVHVTPATTHLSPGTAYLTFPVSHERPSFGVWFYSWEPQLATAYS